jgi:hypothetical protein
VLHVLCLLRIIHHEHIALSLISQTSRIFVCGYVCVCVCICVCVCVFVCVCVIFVYLNFYISFRISSRFKTPSACYACEFARAAPIQKKTDRIALLHLSIHIPTTRTHQVTETAHSTAQYTTMHVCPESANAELLWGRWGNGQTTAQGGGGCGALQ